MLRRLVSAIGLLAAVVVGVFVIGMRTKSAGVQRAVRQMNKAYWNPRAMRTAGRPGAGASIVHHVGRRSGRTFSTPVVPVEVDDGFVVALPYGTRADWVQNVLVAGRASIVHEGELYDVVDPEIVPAAEVASAFGAVERRAHRVFDVDECLRLRRAPAATG